LSLSLPISLTVTSTITAMAHAAEGLYAHDGNSVIALMAEEGLRACATALELLQQNPQDLAARTQALYGAWLCGTVLGPASMDLHHKLCHTLASSFDLPHSDVHTAILAHALHYNETAAPQAMARIARALGVADAALGIHELARGHGATMSLRDIGMPAGGLDRAADLAAANSYPNPRPLDRDALRCMLERAYRGRPPAA